jgi:hypothetical protein
LQLFSVSPIEDKTERSPFHTIEVIKAELKVVLNTFTEQDFHDAFKKWQKCWEQCIRVEVNYFKGDSGQ